MSNGRFKVTFNPHTLECVMQLEHEHCARDAEMLPFLLSNLEERFKQMQEQGQIVAYAMDTESLQRAVAIVGAPSFPWRDRSFGIPVVQGFPLFFGVVVQPPKDAQAVASLTLKNAEKYSKTWKMSWLKKYVRLRMREINPKARVSEGQIAYALFRGMRNEPVNNMQLHPARLMGAEAPGGMELFSHPGSDAVYLAVNDVWPLLNRRQVPEILAEIKARVGAMPVPPGGPYFLFDNIISEEVAELGRGPAALGIDLPVNILVAAPPKDSLGVTAAAPVASPVPGIPAAQAAAPMRPSPASAAPAAPAPKKESLHEGAITRNMGPLHFKGDVVIKGTVETGAVVTATGNIQILGGIKGAFVRCLGSLSVDGGVSMADMGYIHVSGNMKAQFLESASVVCKGSMSISKSILNSNINVGENLILMAPDSQIAGGTINCRGTLRVTNLGLRLGRRTVVRLGIDWVAENKIAAVQKRVERIESYSEKRRNELREIVAAQKQKIRRDGDNEVRKSLLQARLQKSRALLDKLSERSTTIRASYRYHTQAQAIVGGLIDVSCDVSICGRIYQLEPNTSNVIIKVGEKGQPRAMSSAS